MKKLTAADAIARAEKFERVAPPSAKALAELAKVVAHNDSQTYTAKRVKWQVAVAILQSHGWAGRSYKSLDNICREHLGREGYARP